MTVELNGLQPLHEVIAERLPEGEVVGPDYEFPKLGDRKPCRNLGSAGFQRDVEWFDGR